MAKTVEQLAEKSLKELENLQAWNLIAQGEAIRKGNGKSLQRLKGEYDRITDAMILREFP